MRCDEIMRHLEQLAPVSYACDWDNPGLLAGRSNKEVKKVLVALDATDEVIDQAITEQVDLLLTHHPLIFSPLKQVNDLNFISNRILKLLQQDISYYAMHTNFDSAPGCMADLAAEMMGLEDAQVLDVMGETLDGSAYGIGKIGGFQQPISLDVLAEQVKNVFGLPFVTVYGMEEITAPLTKIAISPGSGKSVISVARKGGAQVLITGDIGHHDGIDAVANGMAVVDAGHYGLEHIFIDFMVSYIKEHVGGEIQVVKAALKFPAIVL